MCSGVSVLIDAPSDVAGIEFDAPSSGPNGTTGNVYYLVLQNGTLTRGSGFNYQLTYDVTPEGVDGIQLNVHPAPGQGAPYSVKASSCPLEVELVPLGTPPTNALLVGAP